MSCQSRLAKWMSVIRTHVPLWSQPQATVLALWRVGRVRSRSCALTAVAVFWAGGRHRKEPSGRQQLRECWDAVEAKRGVPRQALAVEPCVGPLRRWMRRGGAGTHMALALAAPTLGTRFTGVAVSMVSRGGAMPVAWTLLPAHGPYARCREWRRLLRQQRPAIPTPGTVIVLADRGLYAGWLLRRIVRVGWHPLLRIHRGGTFRPDP
jgi:hypothetical protein